MAVRHYSTAGVYRQEIDASNVTAPAGTSTGAIVIRSTRGPINRPVLVASDKDLLDTFGKPVFTSGASGVTNQAEVSLLAPILATIPDNGYGIYAALEFLKESNALYVGRIATSADKYAGLYINSTTFDYTSSGTIATTTSGVGINSVAYTAGAQFDTSDHISSIETSANFDSVTGGDFLISSLSPGTDGNNIAVSIETFSSACDWLYKYDAYTSSAFATSSFPIASEVCRIDVYTKDSSQNWNTISAGILAQQEASATSAYGLRTWYPPVETFYGTLVSKLDGNGKQLKLDTLVNGVSNYIYVKIGSGASFNASITSPTILKAYDLIPLAGGTIDTDDANGLGSDAVAAWDLFASREFLPGVNILINPDWSTAVKTKVAQIAATRMDCIAVGQSGDPSLTTTSSILSAEAYGYTNPSYMALYAGFDKMYDQYNDKFYYLPKAVFGASLMARVDRVANTWDAPAGLNRGILPSYSQKVVFTDAQIGQLYDRNINTSKSIISTGSVMWGQKTAQMKASALDRINVRRLLVYLENTIEPTLQSFLFELNSDRTRQRITSIVGSFLNGVQGAGGLTGYSVVCDTTNNTPDVIDNNQLFCDIYVQPSKAIEFITLRTIITRTGVSTVEI